MKLTKNDIENFLITPRKEVKAILLYGPNNGLVRERAKYLTRKIMGKISDPFSIVDMEYERVKADLRILREEINSISFISTRKLIKIINVENTISDELVEILSNIKTSNIVIISAGELPVNSKLRKFFEFNDRNIVAIPCYLDDDHSIKNLIRNYINKQNLKFSPEALKLLEENLSGDRAEIINELAKLALYSKDKENIEVSDIEICGIGGIEISIEKFCLSLIEKDKISLDIYKFLLEENVNIITLIRSIYRYFIKILEINSEMSSGKTRAEAIKAIKPPIFFTQIPIFNKASQIWKIKDIQLCLKKLLDIEIRCKTTGSLPNLIFEKMLLEIISP